MLSKIDLNSDMGESFGNYKLGNDAEMMKYITTANVACGFHAGDPLIMQETVALAKANNVAVGSHPGLPDLLGFGRRRMSVTPEDLKAYVTYQTGALQAFCQAAGLRLQHVKPHGALYSMLLTDEVLSNAVVDAIMELDPDLYVYYPAPLTHAFPRIARERGLKVVGEFYVDLEYDANYSLVLQRVKVRVDPKRVVEKIVKFMETGTVTTVEGKEIGFEANSVCVHGDGPNAIEVVSTIRSELAKAGVPVVPIREIL